MRFGSCGRCLLIAGVLSAQSPSFEVASIRSSPPAPPNPLGLPVRASIVLGPGGNVKAIQATLLDLVTRAFGLHDFQVLGGASWMTSDRFDVVARGNSDQTPAMLRALLTDRFRLRTHLETRELPIFRLVLASRDQKLGPQIRPSNIDCAALEPKPDEPTCRPSFHADTKAGTMTIRAQGKTMDDLAQLLTSPDTQRVVRNDTKLMGAFDLELSFAPEPLPGFPRLPGGDKGPSVFTALKEQLGLRLEPDRGPVEVLVIQAAEYPSEN